MTTVSSITLIHCPSPKMCQVCLECSNINSYLTNDIIISHVHKELHYLCLVHLMNKINPI